MNVRPTCRNRSQISHPRGLTLAAATLAAVAPATYAHAPKPPVTPTSVRYVDDDGPCDGDGQNWEVGSTADASIIKPRFGETAAADNAEFDFDCDGLVSTADFSQIKPLFGHQAPVCP
jgi:hypothetical protein